MTFYDKYLRGVDMAKAWPAVVVPTVAAYNALLACGIKQPVAIILATIVAISSLINFLIVPKTPAQLASEPKVAAQVAAVQLLDQLTKKDSPCPPNP